MAIHSNTSSTCLHNMTNFGPALAAEIGSGVWDTPANFNGFRVLASLLHRLPSKGILPAANSLCVQVLRSPLLAALLHGTQAAGVSQFAAWCKEWNYGTFADILGRAAITSGIGSHSTVLTYRCKIVFTFFYPGHVFNVFLNSYNLFYFKLRSENDIYILHNNRLQYFCYAIIRLINGIGLLIYYCGTRIISVCQVSSA